MTLELDRRLWPAAKSKAPNIEAAGHKAALLEEHLARIANYAPDAQARVLAHLAASLRRDLQRFARSIPRQTTPR